MKNVIKNSLLVFALSIISILSFPNVAYAFETYAIDTDEMKELIDRGLKKGDEIENSHVFAMPDNGWNIVTVGLNYLESYYEKNSTQNIFSFREKIYTEKRSGVGSGSIKLEVSNVLHTDGSNNVIISEFERGDIMYDPNPDKPEKLFLFSTPCVILKKKGVFICYSLINTLIKFMASLPVMTA